MIDHRKNKQTKGHQTAIQEEKDGEEEKEGEGEGEKVLAHH